MIIHIEIIQLFLEDTDLDVLTGVLDAHDGDVYRQNHPEGGEGTVLA